MGTEYRQPEMIMPLETIRSRTNPSKPLTPTLSSNIRTRPAHGLTPRLAGVAVTSPTAAGPIQRSLRQQTLSPERGTEDSVVSLNANITPRSGARISRFDTDSPSTPDIAVRGTLGGIDLSEDISATASTLSSNSPVHTPTHSRPRLNEHVSFLPTANSRRVSASSSIAPAREDTKFFRADDVRSNSTKTNSSRPKPVSFISAPSPRLSPKKLSNGGKEASDTQFCNTSSLANVIQKERSATTTLSLKLSAASHPPASNVPLPGQLRTSTTNNTPNDAEPHNGLAGISNLQGTEQQLTRTASVLSSKFAISSVLDRRRSSSLNLNSFLPEASKVHRKSLSTTSASKVEPASTSAAQATSQAQAANLMQLISSMQAASGILTTSPLSYTKRDESPTSVSKTTSPTTPYATVTKPPPSASQQYHPRHARGSSEATALQPVTKEQLQAAASARRERKVLDLEISNSSLLAINKTLEKELRKQNTELRRFRRLSRSGRISVNPADRVMSMASATTIATLDETDSDSSFLSISPTTSDPGSLYDGENSASDDSSGSTRSFDAMRRRVRDEKRLIQDLQRHQQILLDSQKLTQSIQRCLNSTEEMIKDGTNALAYEVEAKDLRIGGLVLSQDDDEALSEVDFDEYKETMSGPRQGLLSPTVTKDALEEAAMWARGIQALDGSIDAPRGALDDPSIEIPGPQIDASPILPSYC